MFAFQPADDQEPINPQPPVCRNCGHTLGWCRCLCEICGRPVRDSNRCSEHQPDEGGEG